jgi:hypothetical protein
LPLIQTSFNKKAVQMMVGVAFLSSNQIRTAFLPDWQLDGNVTE